MGGRLRFLTAGESHGEALTAVIDGLPAGLPLSEADINGDLARRQRGYGRGGRMKIEQDQAHISAGVRWGLTLGSPLTLTIRKVPLMGDVPILGWLFKQREDFETGRELVVFMTPSILKTDGIPAAAPRR